MNLHQIASRVIDSVNPSQVATLQISMGYSTNADGSRTPQYDPNGPFSVYAQVQELTTHDLRQLEGLNISGSSRSIYLNAYQSTALSAIVRVNQQGGDLVTLSDGSVWLTTAVLERWPDWVKVAVTLQDGS